VKERIQPDLQSEVMKPETAKQLTEMMSRVVEEGTGTAAALTGVRVAGKTGTAEVGANREFTQPWFICFAPVDDPKLAVAVTLERQPPGSQGGTVAAPIAKSVLESMLGRDGGRLLRGGHPPGAAGRPEGAPPALRPGPGVRRALPTRGERRGGAPA